MDFNNRIGILLVVEPVCSHDIIAMRTGALHGKNIKGLSQGSPFELANGEGLRCWDGLERPSPDLPLLESYLRSPPVAFLLAKRMNLGFCDVVPDCYVAGSGHYHGA